jgi:hypothetical protein
MPQYSAVSICAAIQDFTWNQCPLHCKLGAKYSAQPQFTLCELWSRPYTMYLQLLIVSPQYWTERICTAIGDIATLRCALYCKLGAKYSAHPSIYAMPNVVPEIYNVNTAPHIQNSIFIWTYHRCYCRYHINSMRVILQTWGQIQRTSSGLRYVICGSVHIQIIYSSW